MRLWKKYIPRGSLLHQGLQRFLSLLEGKSLVPLVHHLVQLGFITSTQGKGGGIKLAKSPESITIGSIIRKTEPHFYMVECFNEKTNKCVITDVCRLKGILHQGMEAFFNVLDQYTLKDGSKNMMARKITDE